MLNSRNKLKNNMEILKSKMKLTKSKKKNKSPKKAINKSWKKRMNKNGWHQKILSNHLLSKQRLKIRRKIKTMSMMFDSLHLLRLKLNLMKPWLINKMMKMMSNQIQYKWNLKNKMIKDLILNSFYTTKMSSRNHQMMKKTLLTLETNQTKCIHHILKSLWIIKSLKALRKMNMMKIRNIQNKSKMKNMKVCKSINQKWILKIKIVMWICMTMSIFMI